jgi:hypothetical protein
LPDAHKNQATADNNDQHQRGRQRSDDLVSERKNLGSAAGKRRNSGTLRGSVNFDRVFLLLFVAG